MILVDFSQFVIAACFSIANNRGIMLDTDIIRHVTLDSIRNHRQKFHKEYGDMVICVDSSSWRKNVYPYYKAHRKIKKEESSMPWDVIFEAMSIIRDELIEFFPYKVVRVDGAEADDIIAILSSSLGKNIILSSDKDFAQLGVDQWSPLLKKWNRVDSPSDFLFEHIIRGDKGDGIPNIRSADDTFVVGGRQKPVSEKMIAELRATPLDDWDEELRRGWYRNKQLIDLSMIPTDIEDAIWKAFNEAPIADRRQLLGYFSSRRLRNLMDKIGEF